MNYHAGMRAHWAGMLGCLTLAACSRGPDSEAPLRVDLSASTDPAVGSEPPPELATEPAVARLAQSAVFDDDFARAELFSWTTEAGLARLRADGKLLVADAEAGGRASPFSQALADFAASTTDADEAALARLLVEDPALRRRRYAWPSPFATTLGLAARRYGDSLIRVELDPRAWIGRFEPTAAEPLRFVDLDGAPIVASHVLAEPERIAAIFHVHPATSPDVAVAYREFVVCGEAMVREWSIATPEIAARVADEIAMLDALADGSLAMLPRPAIDEPAHPDWSRAGSASTPLAVWHASLAFDNRRYRPAISNLEAIADALRGYRTDGGPGLVCTPQEGPCRP